MSGPFVCFICQKKETAIQATVYVKNPSLHSLRTLKDSAVSINDNGTPLQISNNQKLYDRIINVMLEDSDQDEVTLFSYHKNCFRNVNREASHVKKRSSSIDVTHPVKSLRYNNQPSPDIQAILAANRTRCLFNCGKDGPILEALHAITTFNMGESILHIRKYTPHEELRVALSDIVEPLHCTALELHYHRHCRTKSLRECEEVMNEYGSSGYDYDADYLRKKIKANTIKHIVSRIEEKGHITMNESVEFYHSLRQSTPLAVVVEDSALTRRLKRDKQMIKSFISDNYKHYLTFWKPPNPKLPEWIVRNKDVLAKASVSGTSVVPTDEEKAVLEKASAIIRKRLLSADQWTFTGSFTDFRYDDVVTGFLSNVLKGQSGESSTTPGEAGSSTEHSKRVCVMSQLMTSGTLTDRQTHYKKTHENASSRTMSLTPFTLGLSLHLHTGTRRRTLVENANRLGIGANYKMTQDALKRVATAVEDRMATTGGFHLPPWVIKDKVVAFRIDNIDFLENTPYGQDTLHGTLLVISQLQDLDKEPWHPPLVVPDEARRLSYTTRQYPCPRLVDSQQHRCDDDNLQFPEKRSAALEKDLQWLDLAAVQSKEGVNPELKTYHWSAFNSEDQKNNGAIIELMNVGAVAPICRAPPTSLETLYSMLKLAQDISVIVCEFGWTIIAMDMDLLKRGFKIQMQSTDGVGKRWILMPGGLHCCFVTLQTAGKYIEEGGLDVIGIEANTYSACTIRSILSGKSYNRGMEFHLTNLVAIIMLFSDAHPPSSLFTLSEALTGSTMQLSPMAQYLLSYCKQILNLLRFIRASKEHDLDLQLDALDNMCKYLFAHDQTSYARIIPVYLQKMSNLKMEHPDTYKQVGKMFAVAKTNTFFSALFDDQSLEQIIKLLKRSQSILGMTQNVELLDQFMLIAPEMMIIDDSWKETFAEQPKPKDSTKDHHQVSKTSSQRFIGNCFKNYNILQQRLGENPFPLPTESDLVTALSKIFTRAEAPVQVQEDILSRDSKGQESYVEYKKARLSTEGTTSVWSPLKRLQLKMFKTMNAKRKLQVNDKMIEVREERKLFTRFLLVSQTRPGLVLETAIGEFEFSLFPRSLMDSSGNLLLPNNK